MEDDAALHVLFGYCSELGDSHKVDGKEKYLYKDRGRCLQSLVDLQVMLRQDSPESGYSIRRKLGEWEILSKRLIPLFLAYYKDDELCVALVQLMTQLTTRQGLFGREELQHLAHLQDCKEAFSRPMVFTTLIRALMAALDRQEQEQQFLKDLLKLIRNLVSVPDPAPGDPGYTPLRRRMQLTYIRQFLDEGVLSFFHFLGERFVISGDASEEVWDLADIFYHIFAFFDPQELFQCQKVKARNKSDLAELLARDKADSKLLAPQSTRHCRFGTSLQSVTADGSLTVSASVMQKDVVQKGKALLKREFRNPLGSDKKQSMFHNPFFVDLVEGSVRDHNQLNPHVKGMLDDRTDHTQKSLRGYRSFFEQCSFFSSLLSILRSSFTSSTSTTTQTEFNMPHLLNFVSWVLEFYRCQHAAQVEEAKKKQTAPPNLDLSSLQGAIDVEMVQFTTAQLRNFGKKGMNHSNLLIVLRAVSQQIQTIKVATESEDADTRDCGDILVRHMVKEDVLGNISWIMKNLNTATHDPRILSYSVEIWHQLILLMNVLTERSPQEDFQLERARGAFTTRTSTNVEKEVASLTDSRVVENLFHLLEKYRRMTPQLRSMLVELIYSILKAHHTNVVLFFELAYFMRIHRITMDPLVASSKGKKTYEDMLGLLSFILESFFQCAQQNHCVFAELLFRKQQEKDFVESTAEFAAILDNYENEDYRQVLDRIQAGETMDKMRSQQKELQKGQQPWTPEEDQVLTENYSRYSEHLLCAELLTAELPETSRRTVVQVRKRLAELGLTAPRGGKKKEEEPPSKKAKVEMHLEEGPAERTEADAEAEEMLEEDLERLLDSAYDSCPKDAVDEGGTAATALDESKDVQDSMELELERVMEGKPPGEGPDVGTAAAADAPHGKEEGHADERAADAPKPSAEDMLEMELEEIMDAMDSASAKEPAPGNGPAPSAEPAEDMLEMELEKMMDDAEAAHAPDSLEMALEQMMDDVEAKVTANQNKEIPAACRAGG